MQICPPKQQLLRNESLRNFQNSEALLIVKNVALTGVVAHSYTTVFGGKLICRFYKAANEGVNSCMIIVLFVVGIFTPTLSLCFTSQTCTSFNVDACQNRHLSLVCRLCNPSHSNKFGSLHHCAGLGSAFIQL